MSEKAFVYRTDGTHELIEFERGNSLSIIQSAVNGYIQCVRLTNTLEMWVNENFIAEQLPLNILGSIFYKENFGKDMPILGNILFTGGADDEGETLGLPSKEIEYLFACAKTAEPVLIAWKEHKEREGIQE